MSKDIFDLVTGLTRVDNKSAGNNIVYTAPSGGGVYMLSGSIQDHTTSDGRFTTTITNNSGKSYVIFNTSGYSSSYSIVCLQEGDIVRTSGGGGHKQICKIDGLPSKLKYHTELLAERHASKLYNSGSAYNFITSVTNGIARHIYVGTAESGWTQQPTTPAASGYAYLSEMDNYGNWQHNIQCVWKPTTDGSTINLYNSIKGSTSQCVGNNIDHWILELTAEEDTLGFLNGKQIFEGHLNDDVIKKAEKV